MVGSNIFRPRTFKINIDDKESCSLFESSKTIFGQSEPFRFSGGMT